MVWDGEFETASGKIAVWTTYFDTKCGIRLYRPHGTTHGLYHVLVFDYNEMNWSRLFSVREEYIEKFLTRTLTAFRLGINPWSEKNA